MEQLPLFEHPITKFSGRVARHPWWVKERIAEQDIIRVKRFGWCRIADWYDTPGLTQEWVDRFGLIELGEGAYCVGIPEDEWKQL
jgi:hypothetical protein